MIAEEQYERWKQRVKREEAKLAIQQALVATYESRFGPTPRDIAAVIEAMHSAATLKRWLVLVTVRSPQEIAKALRAR